MRYRAMGRSGLKLSVLSLGSWVTFGRQVDATQARELMALAHDHGVNFFDNAEAYAHGEAEEIMGRALSDLGWSRDRFLVSSKAFFGSSPDPTPTQRGLSRKHLVEACHQALRRLRVDYLDLYYCHRPDPEVPVDEVVRTMDLLVRQGKVLYWGTSEWPAAAIQAAHEFANRHGLYAPSVEQPQYNLLHRDRVESEYRPLCEQLGIGLTTWSPLASGLLSGKHRDGIVPESRFADPRLGFLRERLEGREGEHRQAIVARLLDLAGEQGLKPAPFAIAWCLLNRHVSSVILGASSVAQLRENLTALDLAERLDEALVSRIERELVGL